MSAAAEERSARRRWEREHAAPHERARGWNVCVEDAEVMEVRVGLLISLPWVQFGQLAGLVRLLILRASW